jgi:hypothetical protein
MILFRAKLPVPMFDRSQISIWSILKQCIGKVNHFGVILKKSSIIERKC